MNAVEVAKYVMTRSTGYIDEDIVELVVSDGFGQGGLPGHERGTTKGAEGQLPQPRDCLDFDIFFPADKRRRSQTTASSGNGGGSGAPRTIRVSQTRFVQNVSRIAICTSDGPGYSREAVDRMIFSSAVAAY